MPEERYSKTETIAKLQQTIQNLETIVAKLQQESIEVFPAIASVENLVTTTEELSNSLNQIIIVPEVTEEKTPIPDTSKPSQKTTISEADKVILEDFIEDQPPGLDSILPSFDRVENWWEKSLKYIRSFLPESWNKNLSDLGLTGIISTIIVVLLSVSVLLIPQPTSEISQVIPDNIPPELVSPKEPKNLETAPIPEPELTPEQSLVASIRGQITNFTNQYAEGLIISIQPNFLASKLTIKVSDQWYGLSEINQDSAANKMLEQANYLDFKKLEIIDTKGDLLARSPVVGSKMVIFKN